MATDVIFRRTRNGEGMAGRTHRLTWSGATAGTEAKAMTRMHVRQCPRCELRFTSSSELEYHLSNDHRPRLSNDDDEFAAAAPSRPRLPDRSPAMIWLSRLLQRPADGKSTSVGGIDRRPRLAATRRTTQNAGRADGLPHVDVPPASSAQHVR